MGVVPFLEVEDHFEGPAVKRYISGDQVGVLHCQEVVDAQIESHARIHVLELQHKGPLETDQFDGRVKAGLPVEQALDVAEYLLLVDSHLLVVSLEVEREV